MSGSPPRRRPGRKIAFWGAVGFTGIVSNYAVEAVANRFPNGPVAKFAALLHKGGK